MNLCKIHFVALLIFCVSLSARAAEEVFGQKPAVKVTAPLAQILKAPQDHTANEFVTEAKVVKVCQSKGCWMELQAKDTAPVRVMFKDYGFFVPKEILNKDARVQGRLVQKTLSVREQKHFLKDAKAPQSELDAVREPKVTYEIEASGVAISSPSVVK